MSIEINALDAFEMRRSVRAFLPREVPAQTVHAVLNVAARSPSASNTQPWKVFACAGTVRNALSEELLRLHAAGGCGHREEYLYYPGEWAEPYLGRRRQVGKSLYGLLRIPKGDSEGMVKQYAQNYAFFGAPVGLFFTLNRQVEGQAAWLDLGMFLHGVMLSAVGHGLATCAQQAFARYHQVIRQHLGIPDSEIVVCGMSLGHEDKEAPINSLRTAREPAHSFAQLTGFQES